MLHICGVIDLQSCTTRFNQLPSHLTVKGLLKQARKQARLRTRPGSRSLACKNQVEQL